MAQVQIIQPYQPQSEELEKVAAYCRVSTDSKDQLNSYRTQIGYYTDFIAQHPGWELADIYADEGITGTSLEKRDEFKRMLADCRSGKITRILVKSVSRFGRNTLELIETTRELKDLGVVVVFEEQGIDTAQMLGEMQLTLLAMAAQEESHLHFQEHEVEHPKEDGRRHLPWKHFPLWLPLRGRSTENRGNRSCCCPQDF